MTFQINLHIETVDHCHPIEPTCVDPSATVADALQQMKQDNRGAVLVCRGDAVVGILTERDALRMMAAGDDFGVAVEKVMTPDPVFLRATDKVDTAISMMVKGGYRRLPIVDEKGRPTGMLKLEGILHYLVEHFPSMIYTLPPTPHHTTKNREGA